MDQPANPPLLLGNGGTSSRQSNRRYHNKPLSLSLYCPRAATPAKKFGDFPHIPSRHSLPSKRPSRGCCARENEPRRSLFAYSLVEEDRRSRQLKYLFRRLSPLLSAEAQFSLSFTLAKTRHSIHGGRLFLSIPQRPAGWERSCRC